MINGATQVFGILGQPVAHSLSPAMHNAAFAALGINAVYVPFPVRDLAAAVQGLRGLNIRGVSVTLPFKEEIIPLLDEVDLKAKAIGAVNTVLNRDGVLQGHNTDWEGALLALERQAEISGRQVMVLGAGGAGRAVVFAVQQAGGQVLVADVHDAKAQTLAQEMRATAVPLTELATVEADIFINATPVGMEPEADAIPLPPELLGRFRVVMDLVYRPVRTRLLQEAALRGARTIDGLQMLLYQGVRQFELFVGQPAPTEVMRQALAAALEREE